MKKQIVKVALGILILTVVLAMFAVPAQASSISFTANLTADNYNIVAGEQVYFTVHIVNTGDYEIGYFEISTMRGGTIKSASIKVPPGGDVYLSFSFTIDTTGEIAYQFRVYGFNGNDSDTVITNAVTITVTSSATSTPKKNCCTNARAHPDTNTSAD